MTGPTIVVVRNEIDEAYEYHCDALSERIPCATEIDFPGGGRLEIGSIDGVILTGSTAGAYEIADRAWIEEQSDLIRTLVAERIPTLGVCFGHQIANQALGGTVTSVGTTSQLIELELRDDPLFEEMHPVVPAVHGDKVTQVGDGMEIIASASYYEAFATRHREAPLWTVQNHPEFTESLKDRIEADFGWTETSYTFDAVNAEVIFDNFRRLVKKHAIAT